MGQRRFTSALVLCLWVVPLAHAQGVVGVQPAFAPAPACSFLDSGLLPPDTMVIAAGAYSGRRAGFQIDQSGHEATVFDITVHSDKPVALLLGAYEPSIWSIAWTTGTKVVAVFATGYHRQAVAGLPAHTPIITSSHTEKEACGYAYMGDSLAWVNPKSRAVFGKEATRVYNKAPAGAIFIAESIRAPTAPTRSPDHPIESFRNLHAPLAGKPGLDAALQKGQLRMATEDDIHMVRQHYLRLAADNASGKADIPPVAGQAPGAPPAVKIPSLHAKSTYVVVQAFTFPAGLYGGHAESFIVPKGVPGPTGNRGHSMVIDLNNKGQACTGPGCR